MVELSSGRLGTGSVIDGLLAIVAEEMENRTNSLTRSGIVCHTIKGFIAHATKFFSISLMPKIIGDSQDTLATVN